MFLICIFLCQSSLALVNIRRVAFKLSHILTLCNISVCFCFVCTLLECITFLPLGLNNKLMKRTCISDMQQSACADTIKALCEVYDMINMFFGGMIMKRSKIQKVWNQKSKQTKRIVVLTILRKGRTQKRKDF